VPRIALLSVFLIAACASAEAAPPPADRLEEARRIASADRPTARAIVVELLDAEDAVVAWDAALWLASDLQRHQGDLEGAVALTAPLWERVLDEDVPGARPRRLEARTAEVHSRVLAALGRTDEARAVERALQARDRLRSGAPAPDSAAPETSQDHAAQAEIAARRRVLASVSWAGVGLFGLLALPVALRRRDRDALPVGALIVAGLALIAGAFGRLWEPGAGAAGWWMALGFALVHVVAAFALLGAAGWLRWVLRAAAAWATVGVAFLALRHTGTLAWVAL